MLVLSRKIGEGIVIGCDIKLVVLKRKGRQVLLAISAPPNVVIRRGELLNKSAPPSAPRSSVATPQRKALKQEIHA